MSSNESIIYGYERNTLGLSAAGAAGLLAGFLHESGFDPTRPNASEGAIGIAQWEGGRRVALQRYAAAHGGKETDLAMQLGFLGQELTGPYRNVLNYLRRATDPAAAAAYADVGPGGPNSGTGFENSSGSTTRARQASAQTIYQQIQTGALKPGSAGPLSGPVKPPLTAAQRTAIIDWLVSQKVPYSKAQLQKQSDAWLASNYNDLVKLKGNGGFPTGDPISNTIGAAGDVVNNISSIFNLSWVVQLVLKSTFTVAGLGLAVLGLYAAAHPAPAGGQQ